MSAEKPKQDKMSKHKKGRMVTNELKEFKKVKTAVT